MAMSRAADEGSQSRRQSNVLQMKNDYARHEAFAFLYQLSLSLDEAFTVPEYVLLGSDTEARTAVLQGLLGFCLDISEVEAGVRGPWVLQMMHNPLAHSPDVKVLHPTVAAFSPALTSEAAMAEAVRNAQESSAEGVPVLLKVEYSHCANMQLLVLPSVHPSPASRQGRGANEQRSSWRATPLSAADFMPHLRARQRVTIVAVRPSDTPESSPALSATMRSDPQLTRSVVVVTARASDVAALEGAPTTPALLPADIASALPRTAVTRVAVLMLPGSFGAAMRPRDWREAIASSNERIAAVAALKQQAQPAAAAGGSGPVAVGFEELSRWLEAELVTRQAAAAQGALSALHLRCQSSEAAVQERKRALEATIDVGQLRRAHMASVSELLLAFHALLNGDGSVAMAEHGLSSGTECEMLAEAGDDRWPMLEAAGVGGGVFGPLGAGSAADLPLYGSAACQRALDEFDTLLQRCPFSSTAWDGSRRLFSRDRVANMLLATSPTTPALPWGTSTFHGRSMHAGSGRLSLLSMLPSALGSDRIAAVGHALGRTAAKQLLTPLVLTLCARVRLVLHRMPPIAAAEAALRKAGSGAGAVGPGDEVLRRFSQAITSAIDALLDGAQRHFVQLLDALVTHTAPGFHPSSRGSSSRTPMSPLAGPGSHAFTPNGIPPATAVAEGDDWGGSGHASMDLTTFAPEEHLASPNPPSPSRIVGPHAAPRRVSVRFRDSYADSNAAGSAALRALIRGPDPGPDSGFQPSEGAQSPHQHHGDEDSGRADDGDVSPAAAEHGADDAAGEHAEEEAVHYADSVLMAIPGDCGADDLSSLSASRDSSRRQDVPHQALDQSKRRSTVISREEEEERRLSEQRSLPGGGSAALAEPRHAHHSGDEPDDGQPFPDAPLPEASFKQADEENSVYDEALRHLEDMFDSIRAAIAAAGITDYIRSAVLKPLTTNYVTQKAMMDLFSGNDEDFSAAYASATAIHAMKARLELAVAQRQDLEKCRELFQSVAADGISSVPMAGALSGTRHAASGGYTAW